MPADTLDSRSRRAFIDDSSGLLTRDARTVQGLYCMTPDGEFLSGTFGRATRDGAARLMEEA